MVSGISDIKVDTQKAKDSVEVLSTDSQWCHSCEQRIAISFNTDQFAASGSLQNVTIFFLC